MLVCFGWCAFSPSIVNFFFVNNLLILSSLIHHTNTHTLSVCVPFKTIQNKNEFTELKFYIRARARTYTIIINCRNSRNILFLLLWHCVMKRIKQIELVNFCVCFLVWSNQNIYYDFFCGGCGRSVCITNIFVAADLLFSVDLLLFLFAMFVLVFGCC